MKGFLKNDATICYIFKQNKSFSTLLKLFVWWWWTNVWSKLKRNNICIWWWHIFENLTNSLTSLDDSIILRYCISLFINVTNLILVFVTSILFLSFSLSMHLIHNVSFNLSFLMSDDWFYSHHVIVASSCSFVSLLPFFLFSFQWKINNRREPPTPSNTKSYYKRDQKRSIQSKFIIQYRKTI